MTLILVLHCRVGEESTSEFSPHFGTDQFYFKINSHPCKYTANANASPEHISGMLIAKSLLQQDVSVCTYNSKDIIIPFSNLKPPPTRVPRMMVLAAGVHGSPRMRCRLYRRRLVRSMSLSVFYFISTPILMYSYSTQHVAFDFSVSLLCFISHLIAVGFEMIAALDIFGF